MEIEEKAGLQNFRDLIVKNANGFKSLSATQFKHLKETLVLVPTLPKAPSLAEFSFLLQRKGGNLLREQFEDAWTAGALAYAGAAEAFAEVANLVDEEKIEPNHACVKAAATALLTAGNVPARLLSTYKYIATKQAARDTQKPGNVRDKILNHEEVKTLQSRLDTQDKFQRTANPKPKPFTSRFGRGGRGRWHRGGRRSFQRRPWRPNNNNNFRNSNNYTRGGSNTNNNNSNTRNQ